ncbi:MAG: hypothetical protein K5866_02770 [Treponema sp.]|nr:hypothetical protein [Treponema sp.]
MKKLLVVAAAAIALVLTSCASAPKSNLKGAGVEVATKKAQIIDYKGSDLGADIPGWIQDAALGNYKNVRKALNLDEDTHIWVVSNRGKSLEFLKEWTDQMDARSQIASALEQSIGDGIKADSNLTEEEKEQAIQRVSLRMTDITLNGLDKLTDYWTYVNMVKPGVTKAKSADDYVQYYNYYVVFYMPESDWQKQKKIAMDDLSTYDDKSPSLRSSIENALNDSLGITAPEAAANVPEAEGTVEYDFE